MVEAYLYILNWVALLILYINAVVTMANNSHLHLTCNFYFNVMTVICICRSLFSPLIYASSCWPKFECLFFFLFWISTAELSMWQSGNLSEPVVCFQWKATNLHRNMICLPVQIWGLRVCAVQFVLLCRHTYMKWLFTAGLLQLIYLSCHIQLEDRIKPGILFLFRPKSEVHYVFLETR